MLTFQFFSKSRLPEVNDAVADFVSRCIWGVSGEFGPRCTMGVFKGQELIGAIVYHNYQPREGTVEMSSGSISRSWMNKATVDAAFGMPFRNLNCQAVVARHSEAATHLRRIWTRIGAVEYIIPRLRGRHNPPEVVSVLSDDAWKKSRFNLENRNG